jgi:hypothetical protein
MLNPELDVSENPEPVGNGDVEGPVENPPGTGELMGIPEIKVDAVVVPKPAMDEPFRRCRTVQRARYMGTHGTFAMGTTMSS